MASPQQSDRVASFKERVSQLTPIAATTLAFRSALRVLPITGQVYDDLGWGASTPKHVGNVARGVGWTLAYLLTEGRARMAARMAASLPVSDAASHASHSYSAPAGYAVSSIDAVLQSLDAKDVYDACMRAISYAADAASVMKGGDDIYRAADNDIRVLDGAMDQSGNSGRAGLLAEPLWYGAEPLWYVELCDSWIERTRKTVEWAGRIYEMACRERRPVSPADIRELTTLLIENTASVSESESPLLAQLLNALRVPEEVMYLRPSRVTASDDSPSGRDRLGFERYVDSFARLIVNASTSLPLSIGLFAHWGAGKSSFMRMLQDRIERYRKKPPSAIEPVPEIIPVRFNVWHYIDANIWASLATQILSEIARHGAPGNGRGEVEQRLHELRARQRSSRKALECALLQRKRFEERAMRLRRLDVLIRGSVALLRLFGVRQALEDGDELRAFLERCAVDIGVRQRMGGAVRSRSTVFTTLAVGGLFWGIAFFLKTNWVTQLVSPLVTALPAAFWGVRRKEAELRKKLAELREVVGDCAGSYELASEINRTDVSISTIQAQIRTYEQVIRSATNTISHIEAGGLIYDRVEKAIANPAYGEHLSLIATIREDFSDLEHILEEYWNLDQKTEGGGTADQGTERPPRIRIVLYLDDLDRCRPSRVVEVLEAIHHLLSFKLFVVVVGVDPRWLEGALAAVYRSEHNGDSRGTSIGKLFSAKAYLEKIFQIPFFLPPMDADGCSRLIEKVLEEEATERTTERPQSDASPSETDHDKPHAPEYTLTDDGTLVSRNGQPAQRQQGQKSPKTDDTRPSPDAEKTVTPPATPVDKPVQQTDGVELDITPSEKRAMKACAPLLATPRQAKRLVNVYRVLRASCTPERFEKLHTTDYPSLLCLLALNIGYPDLGALLMVSFANGGFADDVALGDRLRTLVEKRVLSLAPERRLECEQQYKTSLERARAAIENTHTALGKADDEEPLPSVEVGTMARWGEPVSRFSYHWFSVDC